MRLNVENLLCVRGGRTLFKDLSFRLAAGESLRLQGPNGAGKTSLLRMIAGFLPPGAGRIRVEDGQTEHTIDEVCHYVGHLNGIKSALTVRENLDFWRSYLQGGDVGKAMRRFALTGLNDIPAGLLSAGQKRRLALARLAVAHRPLWLLDEPTVSLDQGSCDMFAGLLSAHIAAGGIAIAATHVPLAVDFTQTIALGGAAGAEQ
jgi:heme exporter protein A